MTNIDNLNINEKIDESDFVLRISTPYCNLHCDYCRLEEFRDIEPFSKKELLEIINASAENGIKKIRWTGGEPTVMPDFLEIIKTSKNLGIKQQMLSTNGTTLSKYANEFYESGIYRVNISLDTLNAQKFKEVTKSDSLDKVLESIEVSTEIFDLVKINRVLEKGNFGETLDLIEYASKYNSGKSPLVVRFIELVKGGFEGDIDYVEKNHFSGDKVIKLINKEYGELSKLNNIDGDNPMCYYYKIESNGVIIGIVPNFSVDFECGRENCKKIRVNPTGFVSNCSIYQKFGHDMNSMSYDEKKIIMGHIIKEKIERDESVFKNLKHHQSDYQFWRFGKERSQK